MFQNKTDNEEFDLFLFGEFSDKRIALRGIHKMGLCGGGVVMVLKRRGEGYRDWREFLIKQRRDI